MSKFNPFRVDPISEGPLSHGKLMTSMKVAHLCKGGGENLEL